MDQSLRTVTTQLLNVSSEDVKIDTSKTDGTKLIVLDKEDREDSDNPEEVDESLLKQVNSEISNLESMGVNFGRPTNSKFGYFEISHPGHAMAITEEELEKEMSGFKEATPAPAKNAPPTTSGGISTWILLNPPTTTYKPFADDKSKIPSDSIEQTTLKFPLISETTLKPELKTTIIPDVISTTVKKATTTGTKKVTIASSTPKIEKPTTVKATTKEQQSTTVKSTTASKKDSPTTTVKTVNVTKVANASTKTPKPTPAVKSNSAKPTNVKGNRPNRPKTPSTRRTTTVKPPVTKHQEMIATSSIEKVTVKPLNQNATAIPRPSSIIKSEATERPMFITKIKASVVAQSQKDSTAQPLTSTTSKSIDAQTELIEIPVKRPSSTKVNGILKVKKQPSSSSDGIVIQPIKVNAPVLKIEQLENKKDTHDDDEMDTKLDNANTKVELEFKPETMKIVETTTAAASTTSTKKPKRKSSNKRKKNKTRRRKPVRTTTEGYTALDLLTDLTTAVADSAMQESKIEPETKVAAASSTNVKNKNNKNNKNNKKPEKGISTQIYNFLSREVMPSFGVMSLVGLGLGIASYFLYPFGGAIARRNYEVEPNYKYNIDEYGGNYGQSEEEVFSKVLQGMSPEQKLQGIKDYENEQQKQYYNKYQHQDGGYSEVKSTRKGGDQSKYTTLSNTNNYRPPDNMASYDVKYRNTEFKYPEVPTTQNYYERQTQTTFTTGEPNGGGGGGGSADRQFVVGNVPKEYNTFDEKLPVQAALKKTASYEAGESVGQSQFEQNIAQQFKFPENSVNLPNVAPQKYAAPPPEIVTAKPVDGYDEIEITPTAVAVEHGPRAMRLRRSIAKRESSVIQVIPSRAREEKEDEISNEIFGTMDQAMPTDDSKDHKMAISKIHDEAVNSTTTTTTSSSTTPEAKVSSSSSSSSETPTEPDLFDLDPTTTNQFDYVTTEKPKPLDNGFHLFSFVRRIAEVKLKLGITMLKHASESFARYLGNVQKRINGDK